MIHCPHCDRPFSSHDDGHCRRRMSRRFFFGLVVAPLVAKVEDPKWIKFANGSKIMYFPGGAVEPYFSLGWYGTLSERRPPPRYPHPPS